MYREAEIKGMGRATSTRASRGGVRPSVDKGTEAAGVNRDDVGGGPTVGEGFD